MVRQKRDKILRKKHIFLKKNYYSINQSIIIKLLVI
jgi:hypothetical protein